jgi:hypothetical protein
MYDVYVYSVAQGPISRRMDGLNATARTTEWLCSTRAAYKYIRRLPTVSYFDSRCAPCNTNVCVELAAQPPFDVILFVIL